MAHNPDSAEFIIESLASSFPMAQITRETYPSGNFFVDVKQEGDLVVIEGRPATSEYGVTKNPELFAGSDEVCKSPEEVVSRASRLLRHPE